MKRNLKFKNTQLNVRRKGVQEEALEDAYHRLMRMSWARFFALMLLAYIVINTLFALLYSLAPGGVAGITDADPLSYFAFSVQTMSTVGYGHYYPQTHLAEMLVMMQTGAGLFYTAILTGLVFAKFSMPMARVVFSHNILLTTQNGRPVLCLRLGNIRTNRVYEGRARLTLLRDEISTEGERLRRMVDLKLQRDETPLFALSWTLFHVIDGESPLKNVTPEQMQEWGWELFVTFIGFDEDLERNIMAHSTYPASRVIRARKFADMIEVRDGVREIDFSKLNEIESV